MWTAGITVIVVVQVAVLDFGSVAVKVTSVSPDAVGVPVSSPSVERVRPSGRVEDVQVAAPLPSAASRVAE